MRLRLPPGGRPPPWTPPTLGGGVPPHPPPPPPPPPAGQAYLVASRNLGADSLHRWLAEQGWPVTRLAARSGYRLLHVNFSAERAVVTPP